MAVIKSNTFHCVYHRAFTQAGGLLLRLSCCRTCDHCRALHTVLFTMVNHSTLKYVLTLPANRNTRSSRPRNLMTEADIGMREHRSKNTMGISVPVKTMTDVEDDGTSEDGSPRPVCS